MSYLFRGNYQFYFSEYTLNKRCFDGFQVCQLLRADTYIYLHLGIMFVLSGMYSTNCNVGCVVKINSRTINRKFIATQLRTAVFSIAPRIVWLKNRLLEKETRFIQPAFKCGV